VSPRHRKRSRIIDDDEKENKSSSQQPNRRPRIEDTEDDEDEQVKTSAKVTFQAPDTARDEATALAHLGARTLR
jgi:hypothetical protein